VPSRITSEKRGICRANWSLGGNTSASDAKRSTSSGQTRRIRYCVKGSPQLACPGHRTLASALRHHFRQDLSLADNELGPAKRHIHFRKGLCSATFRARRTLMPSSVGWGGSMARRRCGPRHHHRRGAPPWARAQRRGQRTWKDEHTWEMTCAFIDATSRHGDVPFRRQQVIVTFEGIETAQRQATGIAR